MKSHSILGLFLTLAAIIAVGMYFQLYGKEYFTDAISPELIDPKKLVVLQGYTPIGGEIQPANWDAKRDGVSVDGTNKYPPSMFVFAYNKSDPSCCMGKYASGYSTRRGCVCLSEQQKQYLTQAHLQPKCT